MKQTYDLPPELNKAQACLVAWAIGMICGVLIVCLTGWALGARVCQ